MESFSIKQGDREVGSFQDTNPVVLENDEECVALLKTICEKVSSLSNEEKQTLEICRVAASTSDDTVVSFNPMTILEMANLALAHPEVGNEVMAVCEYINNSVDYEGSLPSNHDLNMLTAHASMGKMLAEGIKAANGQENDSDDESLDQELSDDE